MNRRYSTIGLAIMCALILCAVAASSASARKFVTCDKEAPTIDKFGAHCLAVPPGKTANFGHEKIPKKTKTPMIYTNENTASETTAAAVSVLAGSLSGVATELQCTGVGGSGEIENEEVGSEEVGHATATVEYTGCTVAKPAGKGCVVNGGKVTTNELTGIVESTETVAFKPASGETFANIKIESCSVSALNNTFPVTGTVKGTVAGAVVATTEAGVTTQGTLKFGGNKAGLGGAVTVRDKGKNVAIAIT